MSRIIDLFGVVVVFLILTSPVARSAANVESIIAQVPISDVKQELNGIQREVQGHVFPEPSKSNAIPRRPISSLVSRKFAGRGGSMSAIIDIKGDAQLFPNIRGHVTLNQIMNGPVIMSGNVMGLPRSGFFGMHFHEHPSPYGGTCQTVGDHFNPTNMLHGGQTSYIRHVGDMGNIVAQGLPGNGVAHIAKSDFLISLDPYAPNSIIGKSLVIHINHDDLGRGINHESKQSGNSGTKIACGNVKFG